MRWPWRWFTPKAPRRFTLQVMHIDDMLRVHPDMDRSHTCHSCGETVGIYPSGQRVLSEHGEENVELICNRCRPVPDPRARPAPGAEDEPSQSIWNPDKV